MKATEKQKLGGGTTVLLLIAIPLWFEFREPSQSWWNVLLAVLLAAVIVAALALQHFFINHIGEVGEARFDTRNREDGDVR